MLNTYNELHHRNNVLTFAMFFELGLAMFLSYCPGLDKGVNMYPLKWVICTMLTLFTVNSYHWSCQAHVVVGTAALRFVDVLLRWVEKTYDQMFPTWMGREGDLLLVIVVIDMANKVINEWCVLPILVQHRLGHFWQLTISHIVMFNS